MPLTAAVCVLLSQWISFLLVAVPWRSRRTFVELVIGCLINPEGWVIHAIGAICREARWTTYYKLLERAQVSVAELAIRLHDWFMRRSLILPLPELRVRIIGHVRRDTALYFRPVNSRANGATDLRRNGASAKRAFLWSRTVSVLTGYSASGKCVVEVRRGARVRARRRRAIGSDSMVFC